MNDLGGEITDSLSRSGKGGMTAAFKVANGSAGSPSIAFSNDSAVGIYRSASGEASIVAGGAAVAKWTTAGWFASLLQSLTAVTLRLLGRMADGATAVGVVLDTDTTYSNAAAKLVSIRNNTVEKVSVDKDGVITAAGLVASGAISAASVAVSNAAKAHGTVETAGLTVTHGFNVGSLSDAAANQVRVNFTAAVVNAAFTVVFGDSNNSGTYYLFKAINKTVNGFDIAAIRESDSAVINLQSATTQVDFVVLY